MEYSFADLRMIRGITLDLCRILIYLNFMFDWAASHVLNNVALDEIDRVLESTGGQTKKTEIGAEVTL